MALIDDQIERDRDRIACSSCAELLCQSASDARRQRGGASNALCLTCLRGDPGKAIRAEARRNGMRSRRLRPVRSQTINVRRMTKRDIALGQALFPADEHADVIRPKTRADCEGGVRPCPFVSCKYHLYLDVNERTGAIKLNFPDIDVEDMHLMPATCVLDVAEKDGITLQDLSDHMNMTRERIRQIEVNALATIRAAHEMKALRDEVSDEEPIQKRRLPIVDQRHERMEWATREDFDIDHFVSDELDL